MASIELARPHPAYAPGILAYSSDKEFFRYLESEPMTSLEEAEAFLVNLDHERDLGTRDYFIVIDTETRTAIGTIGFVFPYGKKHRVADLGYGLSREYWGTGAFQKACRLVLEYGFGTLRLARVQVTTRADNNRAISGVEKIGFRRETVLRSFYQTTEGRKDGVLLYLLAEDFGV